MGKKEFAMIAELQAKLEKEIKNNEILKEIAYRHEAQLAREKCEKGAGQELFDAVFNLKTADYYETAISTFSWDSLPNSERNFFNSKRIEKQISDFGKVCIFKKEYKYKDATNTEKTEKQFLVLPFVGIGGTVNCYNEFEVITPYSPAGDNGDNVYYAPMTVGKDCVIITDFFQWSQTNANLSLSIRAAIELYARLIADCETSKKINRNWIKIPLLFLPEEGTGAKRKDYDAFINEVKNIVEGIENYDSAIVSKYAESIKPIPTGVQYFGEELTQCAKDYENDLRNFLGIGTIKNETRARKITAEFEKTADQYNINIKKRLQNRLLALEQLKKIFPEDFSKTSISVNLDDFYGAEMEENEEKDEEIEEVKE